MEAAKVDFIDDNSEALINEADDLAANDDEGNNDSGNTELQQQQSVEPTVSEDQYKNLQAAFTRASQENSSNKTLITQMQDQIQQLTNSIQQQQQQQKPVQEQTTNFDDLDKSASEFEEMQPMVAHIKRLEGVIVELKKQQANTAERFSSVQQKTAQQTQMTAQEMHNQRILAVHPDAFNTVALPDFKGWIARQPEYVQQVLNTGNSDDIVNVLSSYKQTMQIGQKGNQQQNPTQQNAEFKPTAAGNNSSSVVNTDKTLQTFTRAQIGAMSEQEFLANEDAINNAMVAGLIR